MWQYYLMLFGAVLFMAGQFGMNKLFQSKNGSALETSLLYTTVAGLLTGVLFFIINGFKITVTPYSFWVALIIALLCLSYSLLGFRIFSLGNYAVFTMFLMLGGMILPFFYGLLFLKDADGISKVSLIFHILGAVLLSVSLIFPVLEKKTVPNAQDKSDGQVSSNGKKNTTALFLVLCLCVFAMNGSVSVLSKIHQISDKPVSDANSFVILSNLLNGVLSGLILLFCLFFRKKKPQLAKDYPLWKLFATAAIYAACNGLSYLLQLKVAASSVPASVQYPFITGGSVVLSTLVGALFFKEKPSRTMLFSVVLAFASTFLFLI